jgi:hypothetical protein
MSTLESLNSFSQFKTHLGLDFVDSDGVQVRCYQLLDERGYAIGVADFDGDTLRRFSHTDAVAPFAAEWLNFIRSIL